jgi:RNA polymerase sigma-70 factor (ECF subfamily)
MPNEPEARGLLALMLHCEARRAARYTGDGEFVPLDQQDPNLWSHSLMKEAEDHLRAASAFNQTRRYQLEAAIQSIHASRARTGVIDWPEILLLYEGLVRISPSVGALVGRAVALAQTGRHTTGLAALEEIPACRTNDYQPYWAARGHILRLLDRENEARKAFARAASLTDDPALREYLLGRAAEKV